MKFAKNAVTFMLGLLATGFLYSMAALSLAVNVIALIMVIFWLAHWRKTGSLKDFWVSLGPDYALWGYWLVVIIGAYTASLVPENDRLFVASEGKWVFFFYALATAFTYFKIDEAIYEKVFIWIIFPAAAHGIFQSFTGLDWVRTKANYGLLNSSLFRARGFNHNPMTYGHALAVLLAALTPFLLFRVFRSKPWFEKVFMASLLAASSALLLTFTRGAWVAVAAQGIVVLFLWNWKHAVKILGASIIALALLATFVPSVNGRFHSIGNSHDESTQQRMQLWNSNWHMFLDHPWLGVGSGRTQQEVEAYNIKLNGHSLIKANSHNNVLHMLAGTGIFGFLFWLVAFVWLFVATLRNYWHATHPAEKALHLGCVGAWIAFQVGGLTQTTFDDTEVRMLLVMWLAMSIAVAYKRRISEKA